MRLSQVRAACAAVAAGSLLCGCCGVSHSTASAADDSTGIRYYQSSPYLLISSDGRGGLTWRLLYLPDQTKKMVAKPYSYFGRADLTLQFRNGVLVGTSTVGDSTEVPRAILAAIQAAAATLAGTAAIGRSGAEPPSVPAPYLYKVVVEGSQVTFIGGQGDAPIVVPVKESQS